MNPNFFIIGAPKCGTTSLAAWLAEHPAIYMSQIKEPHYFSSDLNHGSFVIVISILLFLKEFKKSIWRSGGRGGLCLVFVFRSGCDEDSG